MSDNADIWKAINEAREKTHNLELQNLQNVNDIKAIGDSVAIKLEQVKVALMLKQEAILEQVKRTNGSVARHEKKIDEQSFLIQDVREKQLTCPIISVKGDIEGLQKGQRALLRETEPQRFANKYPNMFKTWVIGMAVSVMIVIGSALYAVKEVKNTMTELKQKTETTKTDADSGSKNK